jgi:protein-disulfide isomerase
MSKQFWGILAAIIILFFGVVIVNNHKDAKTTGSSKGTPTNHIEGKSPKGVKLIEYGDFQCPGCGAYYQAVKDVTDKYKDSVQFQFRNLPLTSLHPNAFAAARAAEAAALQNKYWEMHDLLYQQNASYYGAQQAGQTYNTWIGASDPVPYFESYAKQLGLNVTKFKTDFTSTKVNNFINADVAAFKATGDDMSTPTFYLNGKKIDQALTTDKAGQPSVDAFSKLFDAALKAK